MKRVLAGTVLAVLAILGLPSTASAGQDDPYFSVSSTSYSGQPSRFSVRIINNLQNSTLRASVSGAATGLMNCVPGDTIGGQGAWNCSLSGRYRLNPGTLSVTAKASGNGRASNSVTHSATVSSRFSIGGHSSPTEGQNFSVSGRYDHISGQSDFTVHARVRGAKGTVAGQTSTPCSTSGGSSLSFVAVAVGVVVSGSVAIV